MQPDQTTTAPEPTSGAEPAFLASLMAGIEPVSVKDLPQFLQALLPLLAALEAGDWMAAIAEQADNVIAVVAVGAKVDRDWLDAQNYGALIALGARVLEVNGDFFVHQVLPMVEQASTRLVEALETAAASSATSPSSTTGLSGLLRRGLAPHG
ncbi:MAG: hypothetical protein KF686_16045 [Ramlibacter sp.]|nr:hypothetical protein [Ramlibacter sp.]